MKKIKENKKKILFIIGIILIVGLIAFLLFKYFYKENNIYIELPSTDVSYTFGPGGSTSTTFDVNKTVKLVIETNVSKNKVKCYSSNDEIVKVNDDNSLLGLKKGLAKVYCKVGKTKSNTIEVKVG